MAESAGAPRAGFRGENTTGLQHCYWMLYDSVYWSLGKSKISQNTHRNSLFVASVGKKRGRVIIKYCVASFAVLPQTAAKGRSWAWNLLEYLCQLQRSLAGSFPVLDVMFLVFTAPNVYLHILIHPLSETISSFRNHGAL